MDLGHIIKGQVGTGYVILDHRPDTTYRGFSLVFSLVKLATGESLHNV